MKRLYLTESNLRGPHLRCVVLFAFHLWVLANLQPSCKDTDTHTEQWIIIINITNGYHSSVLTRPGAVKSTQTHEGENLLTL